VQHALSSAAALPAPRCLCLHFTLHHRRRPAATFSCVPQAVSVLWASISPGKVGIVLQSCFVGDVTRRYHTVQVGVDTQERALLLLLITDRGAGASWSAD
jgi:hypothetical protein